MKNKLIILFAIILFSSVVKAQKDKINIKLIEKINDEYFRNEKQVILLDYLSIDRHTYISTDKTELIESDYLYLINLGSSNNNYMDLTFFDDYFIGYTKAGEKYYYLINKTSDISKRRYIKRSIDVGKRIPVYEKFNLKKGKIPIRLDFLNYLPISSNDFFSSKKYETGKVVYQSINKDTTVFEQRIKRFEKYRKLFLDSELHIFKAEYLDFIELKSGEQLTVNYNNYPNKTIEQIGDSLNIGPFNKKEPIIKVKGYMDTIPLVYVNQKLSFPLVNDTILLVDTTKIKYYIIDFWFLACGPCRFLRPSLETVYNSLDTSKALFFGLNQFDSKEKISEYTNSKGFEIPELNINRFNFHQFNIHGFPTALILDKDFNILEKFVGGGEKNINSIKFFLKHNKLLKE